MKTSYFAHKNIIANPHAVAICRGVPKWFHGRIYSPLAPSWDLLLYCKKNALSPLLCARSYFKEVLYALDPWTVYNEIGAEAILLCWEKPGEFCHRRIVAAWFEWHLKVNVPELGDENLLFEDNTIDMESIMNDRSHL